VICPKCEKDYTVETYNSFGGLDVTVRGVKVEDLYFEQPDFEEPDYENDFVPVDQQEDENDLPAGISYQDIIIMNTDWTVETLQSQIIRAILT